MRIDEIRTPQASTPTQQLFLIRSRFLGWKHKCCKALSEPLDANVEPIPAACGATAAGVKAGVSWFAGCAARYQRDTTSAAHHRIALVSKKEIKPQSAAGCAAKDDISLLLPAKVVRQQGSMKSKSPKSRFSSSSSPWIRLAYIAAGITATLLLTRISFGRTAGFTTAIRSLKAAPSRLLYGQPEFCEHVVPLTTVRWRGRLRHPMLSLGLSRSATAVALGGPLLSVYHAALQPLDLAQQIWGGQGKDKPQHMGIVQAQLNKSLILAHAGPFPSASFKGRGIVIVGGGPIYSPPAYACVTFVRKTGCQLPIEVWTPPHEPIPDGVLPHFEALGVVVQNLADVFPQQMHHRLRKHVTKPAAILASSFREVLLLDADNIPLRDPTYLLDHDLYRDSGLMMWRDFWPCEAKPPAWDALGIPQHLRPSGSHESGELVIDKKHAWKPLLLALYLTLRGDVFYPMFSDNGQGDKETFAFAWLSLAAESHPGIGPTAVDHISPKYGLVQYPVCALGMLNANGHHEGFAMVQRGPEGGALFVHAHLPKASVKVEGDFVERRWVNMTGAMTVLPAGVDPKDAGNYRVLNAVAGYDVEKALHHVRQQLRCDPDWVQCCL